MRVSGFAGFVMYQVLMRTPYKGEDAFKLRKEGEGYFLDVAPAVSSDKVAQFNRRVVLAMERPLHESLHGWRLDARLSGNNVDMLLQPVGGQGELHVPVRGLRSFGRVFDDVGENCTVDYAGDETH